MLWCQNSERCHTLRGVKWCGCGLAEQHRHWSSHWLRDTRGEIGWYIHAGVYIFNQELQIEAMNLFSQLRPMHRCQQVQTVSKKTIYIQFKGGREEGGRVGRATTYYPRRNIDLCTILCVQENLCRILNLHAGRSEQDNNSAWGNMCMQDKKNSVCKNICAE